MSPTAHPRVATLVPIANIAFPTVLIVLVLVILAILTGGLVLILYVIYRKFVRGSDEDTPT